MILAGITIGQLTGNGLFDKVKLAKEKSEQAQEKENTILGDYENKINDVLSSRESTIVESGNNGTDDTPATAWYVKYSNGLIQAWGTGSVSGWTLGSTSVTIQLPCKYATTDYYISVTNDSIAFCWDVVTTYVLDRTSNTFEVGYWTNSESVESNTFHWYSIGY